MTCHIGIKMVDGIPIPYIIETGASIAYCKCTVIASVRDVLMVEILCHVHSGDGLVTPIITLKG